MISFLLFNTLGLLLLLINIWMTVEVKRFPQRTRQQGWDLVVALLAVKPTHTKPHRTSHPNREALALQQKRWDKSPDNCDMRQKVFTVIQRYKHRSVRACGKGREAFWWREVSWEIGKLYRAGHLFLDLQGWVGHKAKQRFPGGGKKKSISKATEFKK